MKKLIAKDIKFRKNIKKLELKRFVLKQIAFNSNFFNLVQWNAINKLSNLPKNDSKTVLSKRCVKTVSRKTFNNVTNYSRIVFLRLAKLGVISYLRKSSW